MLQLCCAKLFSLLLRLPLWIHLWRRPPSPGFPVTGYQEHVASWCTTNTPQRSSSLLQQFHIDTKRAPPSKRCATGCWCHISLSAAAVADVHVSLCHFAIVELKDGNPSSKKKISPSIIVFCTVRSIIVCANLQFTMVCGDNIYPQRLHVTACSCQKKICLFSHCSGTTDSFADSWTVYSSRMNVCQKASCERNVSSLIWLCGIMEGLASRSGCSTTMKKSV